MPLTEKTQPRVSTITAMLPLLVPRPRDRFDVETPAKEAPGGSARTRHGPSGLLAGAPARHGRAPPRSLKRGPQPWLDVAKAVPPAATTYLPSITLTASRALSSSPVQPKPRVIFVMYKEISLLLALTYLQHAIRTCPWVVPCCLYGSHIHMQQLGNSDGRHLFVARILNPSWLSFSKDHLCRACRTLPQVARKCK